MEICKNCNQELNRPIENVEEQLEMATAMELGKSIYYAILDRKFWSIDLCNFCYTLLKNYRYYSKPHKILTEQEKSEAIMRINNLLTQK